MKQNDGGPAYPDGATNEWGNANNSGMSLRDHFAGLALQGLLANPDDVTDTGRLSLPEYMAARSYEYADAMLAERIKPK